MNLLAYRFKRTRFNRQTRIGSHGRNGVFGIDFVEKSIASLDEDCTYTAFGNIAKITDSLNFVVDTPDVAAVFTKRFAISILPMLKGLANSDFDKSPMEFDASISSCGLICA